jgi:3-oxoacyl-[acyl-carrier-protein] synthase-1
VGLTALHTGFMLRAGFPAMTSAPLIDANEEQVTMCLDRTLDPLLVGPERAARLAVPALEEAIATLGDGESGGHAVSARELRAAVFVCFDEEYAGAAVAASLIEAAARARVEVDSMRVEMGEASAAGALRRALEALDARVVDVALLGGVHSDYDPEVIAELDREGRLLKPDCLDARTPGEGAAFVALMRSDAAQRRRLTALARVRGVGVGRSRVRPDNDESAYASQGLTAAVREASADFVSQGQRAGWVLTDLTAEMWRLHEWNAMLVRSNKVLGDPYHVDSPAQRIGHLGAAALPLFMALGAEAWASGYAPSPVLIATATADGGERGAVGLSAPQG